MENLTINQGDDQAISIFVEDETTGQPQDITGWKFYFTAKRRITDSDDDAVLKKDVTDHIDPTEGLSAIPLTAAETKVVDEGVYLYDVQAKDELGNIITLVNCGRCIVIPEVTQRSD